MVAKKMMHSKVHKFMVLFLVVFSLFFSFSSLIFATNYGSGTYGSGLYSAVVPSATASPVAGTYHANTSVTLTSPVNSSIRYSTIEIPTDCSSGTLYSTPILVTASQSIYVRTCDSSNNSSTSTFTYIVSGTTPIQSSGGGGGGVFIPIITSSKVTTPAVSTNPVAPALTVVIPIFTRTLTTKTKGEDVKSLQKYLKNQGYSITVIDGIFDSKTKDAVIKFQKANNLVADGVAGTDTIKAIKANSVKNENLIPINTNSSKYIFSKNVKFAYELNDETEVYQIQKYLNSHGYIISKTGVCSPGKENNFFGTLVKNALIRFQKANKLTPDGVFGEKTRKVMNLLK